MASKIYDIMPTGARCSNHWNMFVSREELDITIQENRKQNRLALIAKQVGQNILNHQTWWQSICLEVISWPFHPPCSARHLSVPPHEHSDFRQAVMARAYFRARCLASRFMKQQVTVAMMKMPTNKAEETPTTKGMRRRSAAGERRSKDRRMPWCKLT